MKGPGDYIKKGPHPSKKPLDYKRDPKTDPHLPHTTQYQRRPEVGKNLPPEALAVIEQRWPEVIRTFQQYDHAQGMLELYRLTRDAAKAAKWDDSMAYLIRDHLLSRLADEKAQYFDGDWRRAWSDESKAEKIVSRLLDA